MKRTVLIGIFLISILLSIWCTKKSKSNPPLTINSVSVDSIANFPYVAYTIPSFPDNLYEYIKNFIQEVETQQIIPTGPLFIITGDSTTNKWALCFPIAEGTMVKEPLTIRKWSFEEVVKLNTVSSLQEIGILERKVRVKVDSLLKDSLYSRGPVAIRMIHYGATDFDPYRFQSEIWVPIRHN